MIREQIEAWLAAADALVESGADVPWAIDSGGAYGSVDLRSGNALITQGGPIDSGGDYYGAMEVVEADLIVFAVNILPAALASWRDVLARHQASTAQDGYDDGTPICEACGCSMGCVPWPCPDVLAVHRALASVLGTVGK